MKKLITILGAATLALLSISDAAPPALGLALRPPDGQGCSNWHAGLVCPALPEGGKAPLAWVLTGLP